MGRFPQFLFAAIVAGWASASPAQVVHRAELLGAWWLAYSAGLDISGLSECGGQLLAVSDKRDDRIYEIRLPAVAQARVAGLSVHWQFEAPRAPAGGDLISQLAALVRPDTQMDFEGLTCDGEFTYLVSERHDRITRLKGTAGEVELEWLPLRWREVAQSQDYLQVFNAGSEGIAHSGGVATSVFWVALERQPRGLLRIATHGVGEGAGEAATAALQLLKLPPVGGLDFRGRAEDLTGLDFYEGGLYTLERNASAVCRRSPENLEAGWCIDFHAIEHAPEFVYADTRFGKAEGLAVTAKGIFVVLDNNNVARAADVTDKRALLMLLAHPDRP
ncbi:esterase-like activity of phytase family protein [Microbulbifer guangxiensis]|uniref:esterase-like activity of phytase family protein n=1 Tax=Microbulbifer guangxiensis TaxID=2904249 RepID=UPI001F3F7FA1|nr:esterase-like activity of phytase family protein [Microbulbifer guangxiensis]